MTIQERCERIKHLADHVAMARARALAKMVKSYEEMLSTQITVAQANIELVMTQAMEVMDRVEAA